MLHLIHDNTLNNLFFDLVNYLYLVFLLFICLKRKLIDNEIFIFFVFVSAAPFFINNYLIDWWKFPDQLKYFKQSNELRHFYFDELKNVTVLSPSIIYSIIPFPFIETINSIGFINKGIIIFASIYFLNKDILNKSYLILLNILPSVFFYSSVSLKDTLVLVVILILVYNLIYKKKFFLSLICGLLLISLKPLHGIVFVIIFFIYNLFFIKKFYHFNMIVIIFTIITLFFSLDIFIELLNTRRFGFYDEAHIHVFNYKELDLSLRSLFILISDFIRFILSPFPELDGGFKVIIFIENIIIYILLIFNFKKLYNFDKRKSIFWVLAFIFSCMSYSSLVFADGTITRYKYTLLLSFLILLIIENKSHAKSN